MHFDILILLVYDYMFFFSNTQQTGWRPTKEKLVAVAFSKTGAQRHRLTFSISTEETNILEEK